MKKLLSLILVIIALSTRSQNVVNLYSSIFSPLCAGDSVKVDYFYSGFNDQTTTDIWVTAQTGTVSVWHGTYSQLNHAPKEYLAGFGDTAHYVYVHIPGSISGAMSMCAIGDALGSSCITITINPQPFISVPTTTFCSSGSFTFYPTGGVSYTYPDGGPVLTNPSTSTGYRVKGTDANGCSNTNTITLTSVTCETGIEEYTLDGSKAIPVYYDLTGSRVEKRSGQLLIEVIGRSRRKVVFE